MEVLNNERTLDSVMNNHILRCTNDRRLKCISSHFPELIECGNTGYLSLWKYYDKSPHKYYSRYAFSQFREWLSKQYMHSPMELLAYLKSQYDDFSRAILCYNEICGYPWHEWFDVSNEYERLKFIDMHIHSAYVRLAETVLCPLLKIIAHFRRVKRGKPTVRLDIYNIMEELKNTEYGSIISCYWHTIRNAIAHGGITYYYLEIQYNDRNSSERIADRHMIKLFDAMLDTCSGLLFALSVFLLSHLDELKKLPRRLLIEELQSVTRNPWWDIVGCVHGQLPGLDQLIIYADVKTFDPPKVNLLAFQTGVLAERYAPGFDRYLVLLNSGSSHCGWAGFNGSELAKLREAKEMRLDPYLRALENGNVYFMCNKKVPKILSQSEVLLKSLSVHLPVALDDVKKNLGICSIYPRSASLHSNGAFGVLSGSVYITSPSNKVVRDDIRRNCWRIVRSIWNMAIRKDKRILSISHFMLGYARIGVYSSDRRRREYDTYGLGPDLICTIQENRTGRIKSPDIINSEIEEYRRFRIAWNRAWIEKDQEAGREI